MYFAQSPIPMCPSGGQVLVLEAGDKEHTDDILENAPKTVDGEGQTVYWLSFADDTEKVFAFTEEAVRSLTNSP